MYPIITIKKGKEVNVIHRHPWIFSGALVERPKNLENGSLVHVADEDGKIIGTGTYSSHSSIAVRVFAFGEEELTHDWFVQKIREAHDRRLLLGYGPKTETTGYRVVFGEADGIPGFVLDRYDDVFAFQMSTAGLDKMFEMILSAIREVFPDATTIIERSDIPVRKEEGLEERVRVHFGEEPGFVAFKENGWNGMADVMHGQKTGFFLDQKDARRAIADLADGRSVLNIFSYSGMAGVAAMKGGATSVRHVDSSEAALALCAEHAKKNRIDIEAFAAEQSDVFQWFNRASATLLNLPLVRGGNACPPAKGDDRGSTGAYGMVILDPPALIKSKKDAEEGKKAYHFLNRAALRKVEENGVFVTSSCSAFMPEEDFAFMLRRASIQAGVKISILRVIRQSPDHPLSVYFPESSYLKTYVCRVNRL